MATTGEQLAAWKQLGGTVKTVRKNKEFIAPGGELKLDGGGRRRRFRKRRRARKRKTSSTMPSLAPFLLLIRLDSDRDGAFRVTSRLTAKGEEQCETERARTEGACSLSLND